MQIWHSIWGKKIHYDLGSDNIFIAPQQISFTVMIKPRTLVYNVPANILTERNKTQFDGGGRKK